MVAEIKAKLVLDTGSSLGKVASSGSVLGKGEKQGKEANNQLGKIGETLIKGFKFLGRALMDIGSVISQYSGYVIAGLLAISIADKLGTVIAKSPFAQVPNTLLERISAFLVDFVDSIKNPNRSVTSESLLDTVGQTLLSGTALGEAAVNLAKVGKIADKLIAGIAYNERVDYGGGVEKGGISVNYGYEYAKEGDYEIIDSHSKLTDETKKLSNETEKWGELIKSTSGHVDELIKANALYSEYLGRNYDLYKQILPTEQAFALAKYQTMLMMERTNQTLEKELHLLASINAEKGREVSYTKTRLGGNEVLPDGSTRTSANASWSEVRATREAAKSVERHNFFSGRSYSASEALS
jgi:hypothetical protein